MCSYQSQPGEKAYSTWMNTFWKKRPDIKWSQAAKQQQDAPPGPICSLQKSDVKTLSGNTNDWNNSSTSLRSVDYFEVTLCDFFVPCFCTVTASQTCLLQVLNTWHCCDVMTFVILRLTNWHRPGICVYDSGVALRTCGGRQIVQTVSF